MIKYLRFDNEVYQLNSSIEPINYSLSNVYDSIAAQSDVGLGQLGAFNMYNELSDRINNIALDYEGDIYDFGDGRKVKLANSFDYIVIKGNRNAKPSSNIRLANMIIPNMNTPLIIKDGLNIWRGLESNIYYNAPIIIDSVYNAVDFLSGCYSFNSTVYLNNIPNISGFFQNCWSFNTNVVLNNVFNMAGCFQNCLNFNQSMNLYYDPIYSVSSCYTTIFKTCPSLNAPLVFGKLNGSYQILVNCQNFEAPVTIFDNNFNCFKGSNVAATGFFGNFFDISPRTDNNQFNQTFVQNQCFILNGTNLIFNNFLMAPSNIHYRLFINNTCVVIDGDVQEISNFYPPSYNSTNFIYNNFFVVLDHTNVNLNLIHNNNSFHQNFLFTKNYIPSFKSYNSVVKVLNYEHFNKGYLIFPPNIENFSASIRYIDYEDITIPDDIVSINRMFGSSLDNTSPINNLTVHLGKNIQNISNFFQGFSGFFSSTKELNLSIDFNNTSKLSDISYLFGYGNFDYVNLKTLNLPDTITNMAYAFTNIKNINMPISFSEGSSTPLNVYSAFRNCTNFNQPIVFPNNRNINASYVFLECKNFNSPITFPNNCYMEVDHFISSDSFNQPIIFPNNCHINGAYMFSSCHEFNQPIDFLNNVQIDDIGGMFSSCDKFNQPIFIENKITNFALMLSDCNSFDAPIKITAYKRSPLNFRSFLRYAYSPFKEYNSLMINLDLDSSSIVDLSYFISGNTNILRNNVNIQIKISNDNNLGYGNFSRAFNNVKFGANTIINLYSNGNYANIFDNCIFPYGANIYIRNFAYISGNINNNGDSPFVNLFINCNALRNTASYNNMRGFYHVDVYFSDYDENSHSTLKGIFGNIGFNFKGKYSNYFYGYYSGVQDNISFVSWDTMNALNLSNCFRNCKNFNQPLEIKNSQSNVYYMLNDCVNYNSNLIINVGTREPISFLQAISTYSWQSKYNANFIFVSNEPIFSYNFVYNQFSNYNQIPIIPNTIKYMVNSFSYCYNFNQPVNLPESLISLNNAFFYCSNLNQNIDCKNAQYLDNTFNSTKLQDKTVNCWGAISINNTFTNSYVSNVIFGQNIASINYPFGNNTYTRSNYGNKNIFIHNANFNLITNLVLPNTMPSTSSFFYNFYLPSSVKLDDYVNEGYMDSDYQKLIATNSGSLYANFYNNL